MVLPLVFTLVLQGAPAPSPGSPPAVPLSVMALEVGPDEQAQSLTARIKSASAVEPDAEKVTFTLRNTGTKAVTAWDVEFVVGTPPHARYGGYGVDTFRQFEGLGAGIEGAPYILPGGVVTVSARLPSGTRSLRPVLVKPTTAVFADASFAGDARSAAWILDRRRVQLDAWQQIARELEDAPKRGAVDVQVLQGIVARVSASIARDSDVVRSVFRTNMLLRIMDVLAGHAEPLAILNGFLDEAYRNVAAATAHVPPQ